ncbi:MAG: hypothetical protein DRJ63_08620 [Thermoprotei archaeon]|nr:MAG: hypothetical protein DRJ63_08620 [Thermoprotei archaeon]
MSDLDALLDVTLDDLEDLPEHKPYPAGAHRVLATFDTKEINGKSAVTLDLKLMESLELADASEEAPKEGDTAGTMFMLDNEYGRGNLKKVAMPFATALNLSSIRDVIENVKEVECVVITGVRKDKNDPTKLYLDVKEVQVV